MLTPDAPWNPSRRQIAAWIVPWLVKSYNAGWRGYIISGYRSPSYSTSLCMNMCGHPTCVYCAGSGSRHSGSEYPNGAVDLSDYYTFDAIQPRIGSPLKNALSGDRWHHSATGN